MFGLSGLKITIYAVIFLVVISLIGGAFYYVKTSNSTINKLHEQVTALTIQTQSLGVANKAMQTDITNVQKQQELLNNSLSMIRLQASEAARIIRNRTFKPGDAKTIQQQANKDMAVLLHHLEVISRQ